MLALRFGEAILNEVARGLCIMKSFEPALCAGRRNLCRFKKLPASARESAFASRNGEGDVVLKGEEVERGCNAKSVTDVESEGRDGFVSVTVRWSLEAADTHGEGEDKRVFGNDIGWFGRMLITERWTRNPARK